MQEKIDELQKRRAKVMLGGGADKLEKQHKAGKLTARETRRRAGRSGQLSGERPVCRAPRHVCSAWRAKRCRPTEW